MPKNCRKNCQNFLFLLSLGLLLLLPLTSGCGWISGWFASEPAQEKIVDPPSVTVESTDQGDGTAPSRRRLGDPAPGKPVAPAPKDEEPALPVETPQPKPVPEPIVESPKPPVETLPVEPKPVEPKPIEQPPVVIPAPAEVEPEPQPVEESLPPVNEDLPAVPVQTDEPVDQTPPVNTASPVETESPVSIESPVQSGGLSLNFFRWIPLAMLSLQVEQPQSMPTPPIPPQETDTVQPVPGTSPAAQPQPPQTPSAVLPPENSPSQRSGQNEDRSQSDRSRDDRSRDDRSRDERPRDDRSRDDRSRGYDRSERPALPPAPESSVVRAPRTNPAQSISFNFRYAPWKDVIEWFADQTALSVQADKMPTGTLNLTDGQSYSPTEGLDILNSYLLFKDYALVRKGQSLFLIYLPDTIPANLLEPITAAELDSRGKYEISKCVFDLNRTTPEIIQAEIEKMLGPQGSIVILPKSQQIMVTETGGTLRSIRDIIRRIDDPDGITEGTIHMVELKNLTAEEALQMMRTLLAIDIADPSLRTAADASGKKILLSGRGDMIERAKEVISRIDDSFGSDDPALAGQPQYEVYDVGVADPTTVFSVLQTLLAGTPDVRLSLDPRTGGISLRGRPASHATVREAIRQMQLNIPQIDIIPLKRLSPVSVVETIKKFIVTASPTSTTTPTVVQSNNRDRDRDRNRGNQQPMPTAATTTSVQPPTVEADTTARRIIVRGTISQIADIRALLAKLGEDGIGTPISNVSTVRAIPLSPTATSLVLEQLQAILPKLDPNIKVVVPTLEEKRTEEPTDKDVDTLIDETFDTDPPMTLLQRIIAHPILAQVAESSQQEVVISVTPAGIVLSSEDPEALNKLESVIRMLSDETVLGKMELKTYNLKNSTASIVSSTLQTLLGTGSPEGGVSGAGSVDLPDWEAEVQGLLAGSGDVIEKTGTVTITADERLNALYIQANLVDHRTIEKLLVILDQPNRDDILIKAKARLVGPLVNIRAEEAKTMVETVFANRMQGSGGGNAGNRGQAAANFGGNNNRGNTNQRNQQGNRQQGQMPGMMGGGGPPGMEMMRQAMMAQMGRGGGNAQREQEPPMTLGVDPRSNSLIVSSSEALYLEVKSFVEELDASALQTSNVVITESLTDINPTLMNQALSNMFGSAVEISSIPSSMTSQNMSFGGNFGGGGGGFRMSGTSTFGGNSPFGNNNPFMNMMRSPFGGGMGGGGNTFRPGGAATFGGGNTFRPGGAATFGGGNRGGNTFGGNRAGTGTTNRRR